MNAKKRKIRIRHGIDQRLYKMTLACNQLVVLTAERNDLRAWVCAGEPGYTVAVEAGAVYKKFGFIFAGSRFDQARTTPSCDVADFISEFRLAPCC